MSSQAESVQAGRHGVVVALGEAPLFCRGDRVAVATRAPIGHYRVIVLENTDSVHNLVVCTLCSCYPRPVLGLPPDWYKLKPYRARAIAEPRRGLAEFGTIIPDDVEIRVSDSTSAVRFLVLPQRPAGTEGFSEAELAALVTRDAMIGVVPVRLQEGAPS